MYSLFTLVPALSTRPSVSVVSGWCLLRELVILEVTGCEKSRALTTIPELTPEPAPALILSSLSLFSSLCLSFSQSPLDILELMRCSSNNLYQDVLPVYGRPWGGKVLWCRTLVCNACLQSSLLLARGTSVFIMKTSGHCHVANVTARRHSFLPVRCST